MPFADLRCGELYILLSKLKGGCRLPGPQWVHFYGTVNTDVCRGSLEAPIMLSQRASLSSRDVTPSTIQVIQGPNKIVSATIPITPPTKS